MSKTYFHFTRQLFSVLPVQVSETSTHVEIDFQKFLKSEYTWKGARVEPEFIAQSFESFLFVSFEVHKLRVSTQAELADFKEFYRFAENWIEKIIKENLLVLDLWGKPSRVNPTGFNEADSSLSKALLEELYADQFIVKEKKAFVIDLDHSQGAYLVSMTNERKSIVDGAAQIASLAVGFNDPSKLGMGIRNEVMDFSIDLEKWDVTQAFTSLLQKESGLPFVYYVNSGAEALETAYRACQTRYPDRKKLIAFEGSFHGRSFLSVHTTHSPSKRLPFETYPELVEFLPFPEDKTPQVVQKEPSGWLETWTHMDPAQFKAGIDLVSKGADPLLLQEIESLKRLKLSLLKEKPLAVILEPMQCEGGDRYATHRFFRAVRVMTRAHDVALVFDEVQTGFGLGGPFFWHQLFQLVDLLGKPDFPDCICLAKKAQVGVCLTRYEQKGVQAIPVETSAASLYRGYLQATSIQDFAQTQGLRDLEGETREFLLALQETLGSDLVQNPRNIAMAFAFDLPTAEVLNKLVAQRFQNGTIFYPAGDRTARFRLMATTTDQELAHIFIALYKCFISLAEAKVIAEVPPLETYFQNMPAQMRTTCERLQREGKGLELDFPWKMNWVPTQVKEFREIDTKTWGQIFSCLVNSCPQLLRMKSNAEWTLPVLNQMSADGLWSKYREDPEFTMLDLLWHGSRALGYRVERLTPERAKEVIPQVKALEQSLYEPERQDDPEVMAKLTVQDKKVIYLAALDAKNQVSGICFTAPISQFKHLKHLDTDPFQNDPDVLYSVDLSVRPDTQGNALGLRLKCEQLMAAEAQGAKLLRSRNRFPEAQVMIKLNRKLSAVTIAENKKDYGGAGTSYYQSIMLRGAASDGQHRLRVGSSYLPSIKNKVSLGNFVTRSYVDNLLVLKSILPAGMGHLYLSSGRAEALDKAIKLMRYKKAQGKSVLSLKGDYFGTTTASARTLGGQAGIRFFDWPLLPDTEDLGVLKKSIDAFDPRQVMGVVIEPIREKTGAKKSEAFLSALYAHCKSKGIYLAFNETASSFYRFHPDRFFATSEETPCDVFFMYCGGQLGMTVCNNELFVEKPLEMISTWEGDEHSLNLFRHKIFTELKG